MFNGARQRLPHAFLMSDRRLVHTLRMRLRWGDMDAMGHINHTVYFRYLEQARIEWFADAGCEPDPRGEGPVIINAHCTFLRQLKYPVRSRSEPLSGHPGIPVSRRTRKYVGSISQTCCRRKVARKLCG